MIVCFAVVAAQCMGICRASGVATISVQSEQQKLQQFAGAAQKALTGLPLTLPTKRGSGSQVDGGRSKGMSVVRDHRSQACGYQECGNVSVVGETANTYGAVVGPRSCQFALDALGDKLLDSDLYLHAAC